MTKNRVPWPRPLYRKNGVSLVFTFHHHRTCTLGATLAEAIANPIPSPLNCGLGPFTWWLPSLQLFNFLLTAQCHKTYTGGAEVAESIAKAYALAIDYWTVIMALAPGCQSSLQGKNIFTTSSCVIKCWGWPPLFLPFLVLT